MSRSRNSGKKTHAGRDLWGPRPMSGSPHSAENKRIARKLERTRLNRDVRKEAP